MKTTFILPAILIFLLIPQKPEASHALGARISYQHITANDYLIKIQLYNDCAGISAPVMIEACCYSVSNNAIITVQLTQTAAPFQIPPNPYLTPVISSCNGGSGFGVKRHEYSGTITLPYSANDWILSYTTSATSPGPFSTYSIFVSTKINNLDFPINSSIQFVHDPVFQYCLLQPNWENLSAVDTDGDSLHFQIIPTLTDTMFCLPDPFHPASPSIFDMLYSSIPFYIHPTDSWINFLPTISQIGHITVLAEEYRNGLLINETIFTYQMSTVSSCMISGLTDTKELHLTLYPNPVTDKLHVKTNLFTFENELSIFDTGGKMIHSSILNAESSGIAELDLSALSKGIYYISLKTPSNIFNRRFVKL